MFWIIYSSLDSYCSLIFLYSGAQAFVFVCLNQYAVFGFTVFGVVILLTLEVALMSLSPTVTVIRLKSNTANFYFYFCIVITQLMLLSGLEATHWIHYHLFSVSDLRLSVIYRRHFTVNCSWNEMWLVFLSAVCVQMHPWRFSFVKSPQNRVRWGGFNIVILFGS